MAGAQWAEPHVALTRQMWAEGRSAGEIRIALLATFGFSVSRNAVISKIHRSHMARANTDQGKETRRLEAKIANTRKGPARKPLAKSMPPLFFAADPAPARPSLPPPCCPPAPDCLPITILDLTSTTCRWPLGRNDDGERVYCGGEVGKRDRHRRYCDHHRFRELQRPRIKAA